MRKFPNIKGMRAFIILFPQMKVEKTELTGCINFKFLVVTVEENLFQFCRMFCEQNNEVITCDSQKGLFCFHIEYKAIY